MHFQLLNQTRAEIFSQNLLNCQNIFINYAVKLSSLCLSIRVIQYYVNCSETFLILVPILRQCYILYAVMFTFISKYKI